MNTPSASPADAERTDAQARRILVWDLPVRVFHCLMVLSFAGAWLTAESERLRLLHVTLGLTMACLMGWRLLWGLIGTRPARFASFVRGPRAALRYLGSLRRGRPEHHAGHNPAGALAIVALIALAAVTAVTGWARRENLVRAMVTGRKRGAPHEGIRRAWGSVAALMLATVLGFWWTQWQGAPDGSAIGAAPHGTAVASAGHGADGDAGDDDDD
jgi:cytochrome b